MDKAQARSQWRTHQHQKKKGRGRGGGEGGATGAPVSGKYHRGSKGSGPSEGLGSNFDRYDEVRHTSMHPAMANNAYIAEGVSTPISTRSARLRGQ
jgi:hypothetical protein